MAYGRNGDGEQSCCDWDKGMWLGLSRSEARDLVRRHRNRSVEEQRRLLAEDPEYRCILQQAWATLLGVNYAA